MNSYGLDVWGNGNYCINENGEICIDTKHKISLLCIIENIRQQGVTGPILLRFPHLLKKQIDKLYSRFNQSINEFGYKGSFNAVFPLKVNQYPEVVKNLVDIGNPYHYGLEAGSKAELLLAMSYNKQNSPITVNGFKDKELTKMGFIAKAMGHDITLTIEGLSELENIINIAKTQPKQVPNIGIRIKLHSSGMGIWAKSSGIDSKFGLTSMELLQAVDMLKQHGLIQYFTMIHFHIGSQLQNINPIKKALREAGNIYAELRKMGSRNLTNIDLGGGLAIEYSQDKNNLHKNYTLSEYANDVVYLLKTISEQKGEIEPNIFIESGRYIVAPHAVLIAPTLELFSYEYTKSKLVKKDKNPPLVEELYDLLASINKQNALEFLHDSIEHLESLLTLFDLGYIDLQDRSNTEVLVHLVIKKAVSLLEKESYSELVKIKQKVQERYLVNFSLFQSLPDFWGIKQTFPVMPISHLNKKPTRSATIWDITCDSDGEMEFKQPLFLHEIDLLKENYFLGFFLVGAYQEVLGMKHNLFAKPTEATIVIANGDFKITNLVKSQSVLEVFEDLDYDLDFIKNSLEKQILNSSHIQNKQDMLNEINLYLNDNGYLKTIQSK